MKNSNNSYENLSVKLDKYINKYYRILTLKGVFLFFSLIIPVLGLILLLEWLFEFSSTGRTILVFGSITLILVAFSANILLPLFRSYNWIKRMNYSDAAFLLAEHIPEIQDELINTLQLQNLDSSSKNNLINASITQKSSKLIPLDFLKSIRLKQQKKYFLLFLFILSSAIFVTISQKETVFAPLERMVLFNHDFLPENPYSFIINEHSPLEILENQNLKIIIKIRGKSKPDKLVIHSKNQRFYPIMQNDSVYSYEFLHLQKSFSFHLFDGLGQKKDFGVQVWPKAVVLSEQKIIEYPKYTSLKTDTFFDLSNIKIPMGSKVYWNIKTKNTIDCSVVFVDSVFNFKENSPCLFAYTPKNSQNYSIIAKNNFSYHTDSINQYIELVEDLHPSIQVMEFVDSIQLENKFFSGKIEDDYGFTSLYFVYHLGEQRCIKVPIDYLKNANSSLFNHNFNFLSLSLAPGQEVRYYFEVYDNDYISGPKYARSNTNIYKALTDEEMEIEKELQQQARENALSNLNKDLQLFNQDLQNIKSDLLNKNKMDWNDKNNIQQFLDQQKKINLKYEELKKKLKTDFLFNTQEKNEEIQKKQELLSKMMEELMSDEMKKLYDELNELLKEMNKNKVLEKIGDIEMSQENMLKELDRTIEHFKRLEVEQMADEIAEKLEKLAEQQEKLANQTINKEESLFDINKQQEEIKSDFHEIESKLHELKEKNNELNSPKSIDTESKEKEISESIEKSLDDIVENKRKKANQKQQNSSEKLNDLAQQMKSLSSGSSQAEEDLETLRQILENLIDYSLQQEELLNDLDNTNSQDPKYIQIGQKQRKLKDEMVLIEDSLTALAKRQIMISNKIHKDLQQINQSLNKSLKNITERKKGFASKNQQTVMMHTNELALLLNEIMEQMQNQMPGSGQCNKPGGKSKKPGNSLPKNADQMKKQIEAMKKFMEEKKKGNQAGGKKGNQFEQLGRMAAEQAAIKKQLMDLAQEMNKDGSGKGNQIKKIIKDLEAVENEIINNEIDLSSVMRQENIKIKLLELEKAQKEQEEDKKREAKEARDVFYEKNNKKYENYLKIKKNEIELLKSIPPNLKPYYKNKVNEYFKNIEN